MKCHEIANVMNCQMSWNFKSKMSWNVKWHEISKVKCHEMSNVMKCQESWNEKCHEMSNVMKCQMSSFHKFQKEDLSDKIILQFQTELSPTTEK